jgi:hypothetical protein
VSPTKSTSAIRIEALEKFGEIVVRGKTEAGKAGFRDFPGRRWLIVVLRAIHLVGLVGTGAVLLGGSPLAVHMPFVITLMLSGIAMLAIDLRVSPGYLAEITGGAMLLKLALLVWLVLDPPRQLPLFWLILVFSAVIAHAPAWLRHRRFLTAQQG